MAAPALAMPEAVKATDIVAGLVYTNRITGECSIARDEVLSWVLNGISVEVCGYYTYEWNGDDLVEVWH